MTTFGSFVDSKLNEVQGKNEAEIKLKSEAVLKRYLGTERPDQARGQFADPALFLKAQSGG